MATYIILNIVVLSFVALGVWLQRSQLRIKPIAIAFGILLILTIIFDNILIITGIIAYESSKISGLHIGLAPIEDIAYTIAAVLLIPVLWHAVKGKS